MQVWFPEVQVRRWRFVGSLLGSVFRFNTYVGRKGSMACPREKMGCKIVLRNGSSYSVRSSAAGMAPQSDRLGS